MSDSRDKDIQDGVNYFTEYAHAAGLEEQDMPSPHHPLLENDDDVQTLADLLKVRDQPSYDPIDRRSAGLDDQNLDIESALTLPTRRHSTTSADRTPPLSDFDADAKTPSPADDADDSSYMRRDDFAESMLDSDPDANADDDDANMEGAPLYRAPDMTGTVQGISRGTATHLPQDLGADGFEIEEIDELSPDLAADASDQRQVVDIDAEEDGDRIPTASRQEGIRNRDDALDATRTLR